MLETTTNIVSIEDYEPEPDYDEEVPEVEELLEEENEANLDPNQQDATAGRTVVLGHDGSANPRLSKRVPDDKRTTTPFLTKYERARVLGTRATQIA